MAIDHVDRAHRAWRILTGLARTRAEPLTYGEICARLRLHHRAAAWFLGVIQDYCRANGLPPLQALVVNSRTRLPGLGSSGSGRDAAQHRRALARVYGFAAWPARPAFRRV